MIRVVVKGTAEKHCVISLASQSASSGHRCTCISPLFVHHTFAVGGRFFEGKAELATRTKPQVLETP